MKEKLFSLPTSHFQQPTPEGKCTSAYSLAHELTSMETSPHSTLHTWAIGVFSPLHQDKSGNFHGKEGKLAILVQVSVAVGEPSAGTAGFEYRTCQVLSIFNDYLISSIHRSLCWSFQPSDILLQMKWWLGVFLFVFWRLFGGFFCNIYIFILHVLLFFPQRFWRVFFSRAWH